MGKERVIGATRMSRHRPHPRVSAIVFFNLALQSISLHALPPLAYEYLPSHAGLRLQLRLFYLDTWPAGANVMIHIDGRLVYKAGQPSGAKSVCCTWRGQSSLTHTRGRCTNVFPLLQPLTLI